MFNSIYGDLGISKDSLCPVFSHICDMIETSFNYHNGVFDDCVDKLFASDNIVSCVNDVIIINFIHHNMRYKIFSDASTEDEIKNNNKLNPSTKKMIQ